MIEYVKEREEHMITRFVRSDHIEMYKRYDIDKRNTYIPEEPMPLSGKSIPFHFG